MRATNIHRHSLSIALAAASCALTIAACGSSSSKPSGSSSPYGPASSPAAMSRCMRANGVPNFPDPTAGPGGEGFNGVGLSSNGSMVVDGISFSGPALLAAEKACKEYLPGGNGPPPAISESRKLAMIANAECMRKHGVPNFQDPTFPSGGGAKITIGPGVNPQSPAFENAAKACGGLAQRISIRPG
jgi:hypothetical protein